MSYQKLFQNNRYASGYVKFVADDEESAKKIDPRIAIIGSELYIIKNKKTYILDSKGIWHSKATGDDSTITCDCIEESTIWEDLPETV